MMLACRRAAASKLSACNKMRRPQPLAEGDIASFMSVSRSLAAEQTAKREDASGQQAILAYRLAQTLSLLGHSNFFLTVEDAISKQTVRPPTIEEVLNIPEDSSQVRVYITKQASKRVL